MLEIPESKLIGEQAADALIGRRIVKVYNATSPHKFAWYNGDASLYPALLQGREIIDARGHGMFVDIMCEDDVNISIGDGTIIRHYSPLEPQPKKHQLLITLDDGSFIVFTVAMYGGIFVYKGTFDNPYYIGSLNSVSPLGDDFNEDFFEEIFKRTAHRDLSVKAFLATEQRIPGLGNGVLQDILFNAAIHPKRKKSTLSDFDKEELFHSLKATLQNMTTKGGRDTEKDFYGNFGRYKCILSKNTYKEPCPNCGSAIVKEAYMGGSVYYCPTCQH